MKFNEQTTNINICLFENTKPVAKYNKERPAYTNLNAQFTNFTNPHVQVSSLLSLVAEHHDPASLDFVQVEDHCVRITAPIFRFKHGKMLEHYYTLTVELDNTVLEVDKGQVWKIGRIITDKGKVIHLRWSESDFYFCPEWLKHNYKGKCNTCADIYDFFVENLSNLHEYTAKPTPKPPKLPRKARRVDNNTSFAKICKAPEPAQPEPVQSVQPEPAQPEPAQPKPAESEPAQSVQPESVQPKPAEPVQPETVKLEPAYEPIPMELFHHTKSIQQTIAQLHSSGHITKHDIVLMLAGVMQDANISLEWIQSILRFN